MLSGLEVYLGRDLDSPFRAGAPGRAEPEPASATYSRRNHTDASLEDECFTLLCLKSTPAGGALGGACRAGWGGAIHGRLTVPIHRPGGDCQYKFDNAELIW